MWLRGSQRKSVRQSPCECCHFLPFEMSAWKSGVRVLAQATRPARSECGEDQGLTGQCGTVSVSTVTVMGAGWESAEV